MERGVQKFGRYFYQEREWNKEKVDKKLQYSFYSHKLSYKHLGPEKFVFLEFISPNIIFKFLIFAPNFENSLRCFIKMFMAKCLYALWTNGHLSKFIIFQWKSKINKSMKHNVFKLYKGIKNSKQK